MAVNIKDLYWIAGFLEGEACFYTSKLRPRIIVSQKERQPLLRLQEGFGGAIRYSASPSRRNPIFIWDIGGAEAISRMMTIWGLMSDHRKAQIENVITNWKAVKNSKNGKYINRFIAKRKLESRKKLTDSDVIAIRSTNESLEKIAMQFGITKNYAYRVRNRMRR